MTQIKKGYKQTEIGIIPEDWDVRRLGEVVANAMYGVGAAAKSFDGKNKYIRITDIDENNRKFIPNPLSSPSYFSNSMSLLPI